MSAIITRSAWGARTPKGTPTRVPIASRTATCTHHDGKFPIHITTLEQACALMRKDQGFHMDTNGWNDIGYNFLVISAPGCGIDGQIMEGRGRDVVGAHCADWNSPWVGIQVAVGGGQRPSDKALASVRRLHDDTARAAGHPLAKKGHRDGFPTICPDTFLYAWLRAGMPVASPVVPIPVKIAVVKAVKAVVKAPAKAVARWRGNLVVDGELGLATRKRLQQWAGTAQDGVLGAASWRAVQKRLGIAIDGIPGPNTWRTLQQRIGVKPDGMCGALTIKALQRYLNIYY